MGFYPSEAALRLIDDCARDLAPEGGALLKWHAEYLADHRVRIALDLDLVKQIVPVTHTVLEFGSVPLLLTSALVRSGYQVTGCDIAPERYASTLRSTGMKVVKCDIETQQLPFADDSFDAAIFNELFEHLRINPNFTLSEVLRVLKPNGVLTLSSPNLKSLGGIRNFMIRDRVQVEVGGETSDAASVQFGIREVTSQINEKGYRLFKINGRKLLVRGAAWAPDMLLRWSPLRAQTAIDYVRGMNLNAIRLEGRMERDEFFDMADRLGVLIMPGWTCCDFWEQWKSWTPETAKVAAASMADQARRLRNHPSVFVWLYGSDNPPPAEFENLYLQVLKDAAWPNPSVSSANSTPTGVTGVSGVKMTGPYEYVPPDYWEVDQDAGGAYGFNTETSPGPVIPTLPSLKKFIPADHLWPINDYWNYHAGMERFTNIDRFVNGMNERYGKAASLEDFLRKSQAMNYEAERAMFEAYGRNKYESTGVIQWMLNNAWPSIIWNLYDYYLVPSGAYFGSKKACEPLHVQYSYDDNSVAVVNGHNRAFSAMRVQATIYDINAAQKSRQQATVDIPADGSMRALQLHPVDGIAPTYFLKLELRDASGKLVNDNFYWLSTKPDVLDWRKKFEEVYTPESAYADLSGLNSLPPVKLAIRSSITHEGKEEVVHAFVENPSSSLAFMVHVRVAKAKDDDDVVPIFWDDNYVSLLPGENRELTARFEAANAGDGELVLTIDGWNVVASNLPLAAKEKH